MKNKKLVKIFNILLIAIMLLSIATNVFALTPNGIGIQDPESDDFANLGGKVIGILRTFGVVLSVVILIVIGIKYMMGSPEEKSEYKKSLMPYVIRSSLNICGFSNCRDNLQFL